jgi:hypothetical protein
LQEVSLYDYRNRVYSADLGRFLQTDPMSFAAGDWNLYRYVGNGVAMFGDPYGLFDSGLFWSGLGEVAGGLAGFGVGLATSELGVGIFFGLEGYLSFEAGIARLLGSFVVTTAEQKEVIESIPDNLGTVFGDGIGAISGDVKGYGEVGGYVDTVINWRHAGIELADKIAEQAAKKEIRSAELEAIKATLELGARTEEAADQAAISEAASAGTSGGIDINSPGIYSQSSASASSSSPSLSSSPDSGGVPGQDFPSEGSGGGGGTTSGGYNPNADFHYHPDVPGWLDENGQYHPY